MGETGTSTAAANQKTEEAPRKEKRRQPFCKNQREINFFFYTHTHIRLQCVSLCFLLMGRIIRHLYTSVTFFKCTAPLDTAEILATLYPKAFHLTVEDYANLWSRYNGEKAVVLMSEFFVTLDVFYRFITAAKSGYYTHPTLTKEFRPKEIIITFKQRPWISFKNTESTYRETVRKQNKISMLVSNYFFVQSSRSNLLCLKGRLPNKSRDLTNFVAKNYELTLTIQ